MNCEEPYIHNGGAYGCGRCLPCRINRRRIWTARILLEATQYEDNTFATLTYSDENLPTDLSVSPREIQLFIKRLRKAYPVKFRYFAVGEYGDKSGRPHYHLAMFGLESCRHGITRKTTSCCPSCDRVLTAWGKGNIILGTLENNSAQYIAGYVTKKWTKADHPALKGRNPEFARMSLRPGIGLGMMHEIASKLLETKMDERMIDVPISIQSGQRTLPLGRYLRRKLRTFIGREPNTPQEALADQKAELQDMRKTAFENSTPLKLEVLDASLGRRIQITERARRFSKRETI